MIKTTFRKVLSANDVGATGSHQAGIHIPKSETELLAFLPQLNPKIKNPDVWIDCIDENGTTRRFRFVYYNNRLHEAGTRNEYRITHMTEYFRETKARAGDSLELSCDQGQLHYSIRVINEPITIPLLNEEESVYRIKLKSSWRRVH